MIRVCPHSDTACPHGLGCTWSCATSAYDGTKREVAAPPTTPVPEAEGGGELVERLQNMAHGQAAVDWSACAEAAREIEKLREERDEARVGHHENYRRALQSRTRAEAAEAQVAVLRKALEEAADFLEELSLPFPEDAHPNDRWKISSQRERLPAIIDRARLALSSEAPPVVCGGGDGSAQSQPSGDEGPTASLPHKRHAYGLANDPLRDWDEDDSWVHDADMESR